MLTDTVHARTNENAPFRDFVLNMPNLTLDPVTALIIAAFMMLLNGGVLGFMHKRLAAEVQPSASDWRVGTLLAAGGSVILASQSILPFVVAVTLGNGCLFIALALYWRAVRRIHGRPDTPWLFLPTTIGIAAIYWFSAISPNQPTRVIVASVAWIIPSVSAAWLLLSRRKVTRAVSDMVLAAIFLFVTIVMMARVGYFLAHPQVVGPVLQRTSWMNMIAPFLIAVAPVIGTTAFLLMCTERMRQRWEVAAATDDLTGLPNRRTLSTLGAERVAEALREGRSLAVAVVDVDHFKAINDRFGHMVGDVALKHVATTLARQCRGSSVVGRQGGEEFVAILDVADTAEARLAAERLREALATTPLVLKDTTLFVTVSIGVSVIGAGDAALDDLLRRADVALYVAKSNGRNRVEVDTPVDLPMAPLSA